MFSSQNSQVSNDANYIEDVFSTWLYTGNGSTQTITNGVDLAGKGGLVWIKGRNAVEGHTLFDTARGVNQLLQTQNTDGSANFNNSLTAFNSTGFTLGTNRTDPSVNYASWTFRKQPKFYTQGTYTGNGTGTSIGGGVLQRDISHDLGSTPGCVIIKNLDTGNWVVYHRSSAFGTENLRLNTTGAGFNASGYAPIYAVSSTTFSVIVGATGLSSNDNCNINGASYVYYVFAHNAGGFGLTGTDNVISCGSFTTDGSGNATVNLGYEPQWVLRKQADGSDWWNLSDSMRGMSHTTTASLYPNTSGAEYAGPTLHVPTATGFNVTAITPNATYIYIAIRRGPMKVPTDATKVFSPNQTSGTTGTPITTGFPVDWQLLGINAGNVYNQRSSTRLTGVNTDGTSNSQYLITSKTNAEAATGSLTKNWNNTGFQVPSLNSGSPIITWNFRRAPSTFDVVCYTGTESATTFSHNLGVTPELMIVKRRNTAGNNWAVYSSFLTATNRVFLNTTEATAAQTSIWNDTEPTSSVFTVGTNETTNTSGSTYVAYLFATCAGVSKVGSYTGTGTTLQVNCGFTAGARFVLIKRTDSTGDWYVWDSARGIVSGNDPYLLLNSTAAEVTNTDYVDTYSAGFEISSTAPAAINASGGTFIFLAIA